MSKPDVPRPPSPHEKDQQRTEGWRGRLAHVIYESDTFAGWLFDVVLLAAILASVVLVVFETIPTVQETMGPQLYALEWVFTALFVTEYVLRLVVARKPWNYAKSVFGVIDLLAILPTLLTPFLPLAQHLLVIRALRLLRVFRILKLVSFLREAQVLARAIVSSVRKILVFFVFVLVLVLIFGTAMYVVEGGRGGFESIPKAMYWAIVTITTVGYGDITPATGLGRFLASFIMLTGYAIIAVPTGIVTVEMGRALLTGVKCPACAAEGHALDAMYCRRCGTKLP